MGSGEGVYAVEKESASNPFYDWLCDLPPEENPLGIDWSTKEVYTNEDLNGNGVIDMLTSEETAESNRLFEIYCSVYTDNGYEYGQPKPFEEGTLEHVVYNSAGECPFSEVITYFIYNHKGRYTLDNYTSEGLMIVK